MFQGTGLRYVSMLRRLINGSDACDVTLQELGKSYDNPLRRRTVAGTPQRG